MRVWFLESADSVLPGLLHRLQHLRGPPRREVHRLRPRRNVEVNKSWMCDVGRKEYKEIAIDRRVTAARKQGSGALPLAAALDALATRLAAARAATAFVASPQATNEDLYVFRGLADHLGGMLDFRVGAPSGTSASSRTASCSAPTATRTPRAASTRGWAARGSRPSWPRCSSGKVKVLVLQGPELLRLPEAKALSSVPFVAVMATHEVPELDRAHLVLPRPCGPRWKGPSRTTSGACSASAARSPPRARPRRAGRWRRACSRA